MSDNTGLVERLRTVASTQRSRGFAYLAGPVEEAIAALQSSEARALTAEGETLRLREALKPFAGHAAWYPDTYPDHYVPTNRTGSARGESVITLADFRNAARALSSPLVVGARNQGISSSSADVALSLHGDSTETEGH